MLLAEQEAGKTQEELESFDVVATEYLPDPVLRLVHKQRDDKLERGRNR